MGMTYPLIPTRLPSFCSTCATTSFLFSFLDILLSLFAVTFKYFPEKKITPPSIQLVLTNVAEISVTVWINETQVTNLASGCICLMTCYQSSLINRRTRT